MTSGGGSVVGCPSTDVSWRLPAGENGAALATVLAVTPGTHDEQRGPFRRLDQDGRSVALRRDQSNRDTRVLARHQATRLIDNLARVGCGIEPLRERHLDALCLVVERDLNELAGRHVGVHGAQIAETPAVGRA